MANMKDRIRSAINTALKASEGTKQLEKSKEITTHAAQLSKVLANWSDPRNDRPSHTVGNLVEAMMKSSGLKLTRDELMESVSDQHWDEMMAAYMAWQDLTERIVRMDIVDPQDKAEGKVAAAAVTVEETPLQKLAKDLQAALKAKDKTLQKEIMEKMAQLE